VKPQHLQAVDESRSNVKKFDPAHRPKGQGEHDKNHKESETQSEVVELMSKPCSYVRD